MSMSRKELTFSSGRDTCAAWFYPAAADEGVRPIIVMAHGLSGTRRDRLGAFADRFSAAGIAAWPNPARDMVSLQFGSAGAAYSILMYDGAGRCVDRTAGTAIAGVNRVDISLGRFASGIYTIVILDKDGKRVTTIRKE